MLRRSADEALRGILLADRILANPAKVITWMVHWALASERQHQEFLDLDWRLLCAKLDVDPKIEVPDNGQILCALHSELDELGGHKGVRRYAC